MIRLTLILLAAIAVTLSVAGREIETPEVAESGARPATTTPGVAEAPGGRLALDDEAGAIERAISATAELDPIPAVGAAPRSATPEPAPPSDWAVVNADRVNLRTGPSTANPVIDQVVRDQRVEVLDRTDDGWMRIRVGDTGREAFIFGRFLTPQG